jgi:hypothetical protein
MEDDAWDDAWLEAEIAKEMAACDLSVQPTAPETDYEAEQVDQGETAFESAAMDNLASYISSRDVIYVEMQQKMGEDLEEVNELAGKVTATEARESILTAAEPSQTPTPVHSPEIFSTAADCTNDAPPGAREERTQALAANPIATSEDTERRLLQLKQSFALVENRVEMFEGSNMRVDALAAREATSAVSLHRDEVGAFLDNDDNTSVSIPNAEHMPESTPNAWESAATDATQATSVPTSSENIYEQKTAAVETAVAADSAALALAEAMKVAEEDRAKANVEAAEADAEAAAADAKLQEDIDRLEAEERQQKLERDEVDATRAQLQAQQADETQRLLELQLQQEQRRVELREERETAAREKYEREMNERAAVAERHRKKEEESRARLEAEAERLEMERRAFQEQLRVADGQRLQAIEEERAAEAAHAARQAEEQAKAGQAILEREEGEKLKESERLARQTEREQQKRVREEAWTMERALLAEYEASCAAHEVEGVCAVLEKMRGLDRLDREYADGRQKLAQWRIDELIELIRQISRSTSSDETNRARERCSHLAKVDHLNGNVLVSELILASQLSLQARDAILCSSQSDLEKLLPEVTSIPILTELAVEMTKRSQAFSDRERLQQDLDRAESEWDLPKLQDVVLNVQSFGPVLQPLAGRCQMVLDKLTVDDTACQALITAQEMPHMTNAAIECAAKLVRKGLFSSRLQSLLEAAQGRLARGEECKLLSSQRAAVSVGDIGSLNIWIAKAQRYVELTADVAEASSQIQHWQHRAAVKLRIYDSTQNRNVHALQAAAHACTGDSGLDTELAAANMTLKVWERQNALCLRMATARSKSSREEVLACIATVEKNADLRCLQVDEGLGKCHSMEASWDEENKLTQQLLRAVRTRDIKHIATAITAARRCQSLRKQVNGAEKMLLGLEEDASMQDLVADAYRRRSTTELRILLQQPNACKIYVSGKSVSMMLDEVHSEHIAKDRVMRAFIDGNTQQLSSALATMRAHNTLATSLENVIRLATPGEDVIAAETPIECGKDDSHFSLAVQLLCDDQPVELCKSIVSSQRNAAGKVVDPKQHPARPPDVEQTTLMDMLPDLHNFGESEVIQKLNMGLENLQSIPDLDGYDNLLSINLKVNTIGTINGLDKCKTLHEVFLNDNHIKSLCGSVKLPKLRTLSVEQNQLETLAGIQDCKYIRSLLASNNSIADVSHLKSCDEIERLSLYRNQITQLHSLEHLFWLQHLDVGRNRLVSITGLGCCPLLQTLVLYENQISELPTDPAVMHLPLLRELWLSGNPLKKLKFTGWMPSLEHLHVSDAQISEIASLHRNRLLRSIDLSFNQLSGLSDLTALSSCRLLEVIRLNDNPISSSSQYKSTLVMGLPSLRELDNEPIDAASTRVQEMHNAFIGSGWLLGSAKSFLHRPEAHRRPGWWLSSDSSTMDWVRMVRIRGAGQHVSLPGVGSHRADLQAAWQSRGHSVMCVRQRQRNTKLMKVHRRNTNARQQTDDVLLYSNHLRSDENDGAQMRRHLCVHLSEHVKYSSTQHQHVFSLNQGYSHRIDKWRSLRSANTIQRIWRGWKYRKDIYTQKNDAATCIQKKWRLNRFNRAEAAGGPDARRIQAVYRGHHVRRKLTAALVSAKYLDDDAESYDGEIDETEFALPDGLEDTWAPDYRLSVERVSASQAKSVADAPRIETLPPLSDNDSMTAMQNQETLECRSNTDAGGALQGYHQIYKSIEIPPAHPASPPSTDRSSNAGHSSRVAGLMERMQHKQAGLASEWGLKDPRTIEAMAKKAQKYKRHETKAKQKHSTATQRLDQYRNQFSGSPAPTAPSSARSEPHRSGPAPLVRRLESAPPSPAQSKYSDNGTGLVQFQSGEPNLRASRELASRGRDHTQGVVRNNFVQPITPPAAVPAAAAWGMAAGDGSAAMLVGPGANTKRKKRPKAKVPRVANIRR